MLRILAAACSFVERIGLAEISTPSNPPTLVVIGREPGFSRTGISRWRPLLYPVLKEMNKMQETPGDRAECNTFHYGNGLFKASESAKTKNLSR
jgi:hypothetical protein